MFGGESSHLPLKLNTAGVIPPIFASSILLLPVTAMSFNAGSGGPGWLMDVTALLGRGQPLYMALYISAIVFFAFFYTSIVFSPADTADNLKKNGGFIPGIRPGQPTQEYLNRVILRITWGGALFLGVIAIIPFFVTELTGVRALTLSSTSLLIMVGVALDTMRQLEAQLLMRNYEGFIR